MPGEAAPFGESSTRDDIKDIILNNLSIAIYVSDMATNKILFANAQLCKMYGDNALTGRICWEALRNLSKRCEFCPIPYLLKNPGKSYQWELCIKDKTFLIHDSIIPWSDGRLAHLQYMVEITYRRLVSL